MFLRGFILALCPVFLMACGGGGSNKPSETIPTSSAASSAASNSSSTSSTASPIAAPEKYAPATYLGAAVDTSTLAGTWVILGSSQVKLDYPELDLYQVPMQLQIRSYMSVRVLSDSQIEINSCDGEPIVATVSDKGISYTDEETSSQLEAVSKTYLKGVEKSTEDDATLNVDFIKVSNNPVTLGNIQAKEHASNKLPVEHALTIGCFTETEITSRITHLGNSLDFHMRGLEFIEQPLMAGGNVRSLLVSDLSFSNTTGITRGFSVTLSNNGSELEISGESTETLSLTQENIKTLAGTFKGATDEDNPELKTQLSGTFTLNLP